MHCLAMETIVFASLLSCITFCQVSPAPPTVDISTLYKIGNCTLRPGQFQYEAIPGLGWDNLQNRALGRVLAIQYETCGASEDGKFLLPDSVYLIPHKSSAVHLQSEMIRHYSNYSSMTSFSINVEASAGLSFGSISGSFSSGYQDCKTNQINKKSVTTRVQLRHEIYTARYQPDAKLDPAFRNRVLDIASLLITDAASNQNHANYLADLLVRDFGTHIITSSVAGGILSKVDNIKSTFIENAKSHKVNIDVAAAASFFSMVKGSMSSHYDKKTAQVDIYEKNVEDSTVLTFGGPLFGANFSLADWEKDLMNNLVTVDRFGDPIYYMLVPRALPELPDPIVFKLSKTVQSAVQRYYKANAIIGCMNITSSNFNSHANVDSNDCKFPTSNFSLGGIYQTCTGPDNLCQLAVQKNPSTGEYSCPTGFKSIELHSGQFRCQQRCERYHLFWTRCWTECANYKAFWCWNNDGGEPGRSFLLGGLYTANQRNPVTNDHTCPPTFIGVKMSGMIVCLSTDRELGRSNSLPFGGFFSCKVGNPLATAVHGSGLRQGSNSFVSTKYLMETMNKAQQMPFRCPQGYSQHLATLVDSCQISYCLLQSALRQVFRQILLRPPFVDLTFFNSNSSDVHMITGPDGRIWKKDDKGKWILTNPSTWHAIYNTPGNPGAAVGIIIVTTLLVGIVVAAVVFLAYRRFYHRLPLGSRYQNRNLQPESDTASLITTDHTTYGSDNQPEPPASDV